MKKSKSLARRENHVVSRLQPEQLHRVIQSRGLEDSGELVRLATPEQLTRIFDLDLWRAPEPGMDEQFDADRFGLWLEVLAEVDASEAARKLAEMDVDLVIVGLAQHARVFDGAVLVPYTETDGVEVGGYWLFAKRTDSWDAIVTILISLDAEHPDYFHQLMRGCRALSNSDREPDVQDLPSEEIQSMFDLAVHREQRRERQGYVTPAQARAFLEASRRIRFESRPANPIVRTNVHMLLQFVFDRDRAAFDKRNEELTYIGNTIMAGCRLLGRSFATKEASDAAVAVCDLGLESWPVPDDFLVDNDLVKVFQAGWSVLHKDVGMYTAAKLLKVLADLKSDDRDLQAGLHALRVELSKACRIEMPWLALEALDVIQILDMTAWAALHGLIDECPVLHAAVSASQSPRVRSVGASAFEFISGNSQIALIHEYLQSLPETLCLL